MTLHLDTIEYIMDINIKEITTGIRACIIWTVVMKKILFFLGMLKMLLVPHKYTVLCVSKP